MLCLAMIRNDGGLVEDEKVRWEVCGVGICLCASQGKACARLSHVTEIPNGARLKVILHRLQHPLATSEMLGQAPKEPTSKLLPLP